MSIPVHRKVFESLRDSIAAGRYAPGQKLPSEAALVRQFDTSRITVGRALRDLQHAALVERRKGSGTFVRGPRPSDKGLIFGLLIPELGRTEIFEPVCQGIAGAARTRPFALLWGNASPGPVDSDTQARHLCRQFLEQKVSGVFFAPVERSPGRSRTNTQILDAFEDARIPVVLLDRSAAEYPRRTAHDLVAVDNRKAGYLVTEHLLKLGAKRVGFVALPHSASTVEARTAGYRDALFAAGAALKDEFVQRIDPAGVPAVKAMMRSRLDAIVCANDRTAGALMHTLIALGYDIPSKVRVTGIDDVEYARLLPVPLTTVRQPCREIGEAALAAMLERVAGSAVAPREILLDCELVVRSSCGARLLR